MAGKMNAITLMEKSKSAKERAAQYGPRIKKSIQQNVISHLEEKIAQKEDQIYDLKNFDLATDLNAGKKEMTKDQCENRFLSIIEAEYDKSLLELELKVKKEAFVALFGE